MSEQTNNIGQNNIGQNNIVAKENNAVKLIQASKKPLDLFLEYDGLILPELEKFGIHAKSVAFDFSTKKGRDACKSFVYKIRRDKVAVKNVGDALAKEVKEIPKRLDESRRKITNYFDCLIEEIEKPVVEFEKKEAERVNDIKNKLETLRLQVVFDGFQPSSIQIQERSLLVKDFVIDDSFAEFKTEALTLRENLLADLSQRFLNASEQEKQAAELKALQDAEIERKRLAEIDAQKKYDRELRLQKLLSIPNDCAEMNLSGLNKKLESVVNAKIIVDEWVELYTDAVNAKDGVVAKLKEMIASAELDEERKLQEAALKAQQEAEQKADAELKAQQEAALKAQQIMMQENVIISIESFLSLDLNSKQLNEKLQEFSAISFDYSLQAKASNMLKMLKEKLAVALNVESKAKDLEHRSNVESSIYSAIKELNGISDDIATKFLTALKNGVIPHVTINY